MCGQLNSILDHTGSYTAEEKSYETIIGLTNKIGIQTVD